MRIFRAAVVGAAASILLALFLLATAHARADEPVSQRFDIGPQSLATALSEFARQSHEELLFAPEVVAKKSSPGVHGTMVPQAALSILLKDSGLSFSTTPSGAILVGAPGGASPRSTSQQPPTDVPPDQQPRSFLQPAQANPGQGQAASAIETPSDKATEEKKKELLQEVVVTGTHIRGATDSGSPILRLDRGAIDKTGLATTEQLFQSLPQNYGGGNSSAVVGGMNGGEDSLENFSAGTGINLRGLGNEATLVLLNGHRLAPASIGNFVDVSMIPLSAVESIDVLTDGASAIYGSDAIAGVVNIRLRSNFDGAETTARYGGAVAYDNYQASQLLGTTWSSGSALLAIDYRGNSSLGVQDRSFTDTAGTPTDLIGREHRRGLVVSASQNVASQTAVFGRAL